MDYSGGEYNERIPDGSPVSNIMVMIIFGVLVAFERTRGRVFFFESGFSLMKRTLRESS